MITGNGERVAAPAFNTLNSSALPPPPVGAPFNTSSDNNSAPSSTNVVNGVASYSDELSFHTTSYPGSYDSSFSSDNSPLVQPSSYPPQTWGQPQPPYQIIYQPFPRGKDMEPILEPGEVPAPRPPMSYAALIGEALLMAPPPHQLYVSEISDLIKKRYACEYP